MHSRQGVLQMLHDILLSLVMTPDKRKCWITGSGSRRSASDGKCVYSIDLLSHPSIAILTGFITVAEIVPATCPSLNGSDSDVTEGCKLEDLLLLPVACRSINRANPVHAKP